MKNNSGEKIFSSFRDPSGFVFKKNNRIFRQVNEIYKQNYDFFVNSGLATTLIKKDLILPFKEAENVSSPESQHAYKILEVKNLEFISYPYEWCFSQLKDAALHTLEIQKVAITYGMTLKDASAYNIQFFDNKPVLIDIFSFEKYNETKPWIAYSQFCRHFLCPLVLMSFVDSRLGVIYRNFIDGLPLDFTVRLLPPKKFFNFGVLTHILLHSKAGEYFPERKFRERKFSKSAMLGLVESLEGFIRKLEIKRVRTEWSDYYDRELSYTKKAFQDKVSIVKEYLSKIPRGKIWDLGANTGYFSRIAVEFADFVVSSDVDCLAIEKNYIESKKRKIKNVFPLIIDLVNPSPSIGWENKEREPFLERCCCDTIIALALLHHLVISNNLSFEMLAEFFCRASKNLIIEFIPKSDPLVKGMLIFRRDIFEEYFQEKFEYIFSKYFAIRERRQIKESDRFLYLMEKK